MRALTYGFGRTDYSATLVLSLIDGTLVYSGPGSGFSVDVSDGEKHSILLHKEPVLFTSPGSAEMNYVRIVVPIRYRLDGNYVNGKCEVIDFGDGIRTVFWAAYVEHVNDTKMKKFEIQKIYVYPGEVLVDDLQSANVLVRKNYKKMNEKREEHAKQREELFKERGNSVEDPFEVD